MFCTQSDLVTESDVEQKLLWPLLRSAPPQGLGFSTAELLTKPSLRRIEIGKGKSKRLYYPDYIAVVEGIPVLVAEAKSPEEDLPTALDEARMYAAVVNTLFPPDVNPCQWVVACNGKEVIATRWDSAIHLHSLRFEDISSINVQYAAFVEALSRTHLITNARSFRKSRAPQPLARAVSEMGGQSARNEQIGHNTFGSTLALDYRGVFTPSSPRERAYVVQHAYVPSRRRERYVDPIEKLIRDASTPFMQHIKQIEDTQHPGELVKALSLGASLEHQLMLLVGSVGSGKSTFVDFLVNVALPRNLLERTLWLRVNLNLTPQAHVQDWLLEQIAKELMASAPNTDFADLTTIKILYAPELARLEKGPLRMLDPASDGYRERVADEMRAWQKDKMITVNALVRMLCGHTGKLLMIVLDNCDKRTRDEQLAMFQLAQWVQSELRCLTILPLRDITYELHKDEPPLDTTQKDLVFRIEPPQFTRVLSGRISLALRDLTRGATKSLEYALPNGMRVKYPVSDQGMYLACILRSIYEHDRFLRRLLSGLAGRNIRRALEIFLEFCQSGYISEAEILKIRQLQGNYVLPLPVVAAVLLRLNRRFYDGDVSYVKNMFQAHLNDTTPDHFVRLAILNFLGARRSLRGPSGIRGYHRVDTVLQALVALGHSLDRAQEEMLYLLRANCVIAEHQRTDALADEDLVTISPSGWVHLGMLESTHYLAACAEDTWMSDRGAVKRIKDRVSHSRFSHTSEATVVLNARELIDVLAADDKRWHSELTGLLAEGVRENLHDWSAAKEAVERAEREQRLKAMGGRLFITNLPFNVTREEVEAVFVNKSIPVIQSYIAKGPDGRGKGYGFVSVGDADAVERAVRLLNGVLIRGRSMTVRIAEEKKPDQNEPRPVRRQTRRPPR